MTAIDPNLPAQLKWAANQVDSIVADPFWKNRLLTQPMGGDGDLGYAWYGLGDAWSSNLWVGRAASAHVKEFDEAKRKVEDAHQRLVALRDELERQAQAAANQIEAQNLIDQLTNLLRQL